MADFIDSVVPEEPFLEIGVAPKETTKTDIDIKKDWLALTLELTSDEVAAGMESGQEALFTNQAKSKANGVNTSKAEEKVSKVLSEQPEDAEDQLLEAGRQLQYTDYVSPDFAAALNEHDTFNETQKKMFDKRMAAERIVSRKRGESTEGFVAGVGYFLDTAVSSIVHNVIGGGASLIGMGEETFEGGAQLQDLAQEAAMLYVSDIPADEFEQRFEAILDRVQDAGGFTEDNPFYLEGFLAMVDEGGVGLNTDFELLFQALDIVSLGTSSAAKMAVKAGARSGSVPRAVSKFKSSDEAAKIVVREGDKRVDSSAVSEGTSTAMIRPATETPDYHAAPEMLAMRDLEANNAIFTAFKQYDFGPFVDPAIIAEKKAGWLEETRELNKKYKRRELDYNIRTDSFGNIFGQAFLGKRDGKAFKTLKGAENFANDIGGDVVKQLHEGKEQWIVTKEWAIPTEGLADATDVQELATGFFSSILSTTAKTTPELDAILKQGEAKTSLVLNDLGKQYKKVSRGVKWSERKNVDAIMEDLRDDPLVNSRIEPYTTEEFRDTYTAKHGVEPRKEVLDFYDTLVEINDVDYYINADRLLKEAVNNKEEMVKVNGVFRRSRVVKDLEPDEKVWDNHTKKLVDFSDLDPEVAVVREIDGMLDLEGIGLVRYTVDQAAITRRLYHSDVLPYNIGGHRKYSTQQKFFLKQESDIKLAGGKTTKGTPKTFMGVRFEQEAKITADQWNTISAAIKADLPVDQVNKVILDNNAWNRSIEDVADLENFAAEHNLDILKEVQWVPDGEGLEGGFAGKGTVGDGFRNSLNSAKRRGDKPLIGFGGEGLDTLNPTKAIERGFAQTVARRGEMNYLFNAITGWTKAAQDSGAITKVDANAVSPKALFDSVQLSKSSVGVALETERQTIRQRLSSTTSLVTAERNLMSSIASFVYGKGGVKLAKTLDWASTKDPAGFLRAMAFHTKLGMFNIDQVYVQANQIINIMGVTSATIGPIGAVRSVLGVLPMRMALVKDIPDGALAHIAKVQAPFTGISADEFITLRDWFKSTGRNIVDRTVVEENNSVAFLGSSVLDWGQVFFKEGELASRISATTATFLERKAKGFKEDIFDPHVTRQMMQRQDVLTASMTSASAAPWQRSLMAVPLQFTTYHVRMVEQLFTDRILTPKERVSLGLSHLLFYGTAAVPAAGFLQDKLGFDGVVDPNSGAYDYVRYGAMDAILTGLSGEETALSTRLAVGEGVWDLLVKFSQEPLPTLAAGPGGGITIESLSALTKFMNNVMGGHFEMATYDWNRFARNVSSYNKAYVNYVGRRYGEMISRNTEAALQTDMSTIETTLATMGIPLREQDVLWSTVPNLKQEKAQFERHVKEILRTNNILNRELREETKDYDKIGKLIENIGAQMAILQPHEKRKALQRLKMNSDVINGFLRNLMTTGHTEIANKLEAMQNGNP